VTGLRKDAHKLLRVVNERIIAKSYFETIGFWKRDKT